MGSGNKAGRLGRTAHGLREHTFLGRETNGPRKKKNRKLSTIENDGIRLPRKMIEKKTQDYYGVLGRPYLAEIDKRKIYI